MVVDHVVDDAAVGDQVTKHGEPRDRDGRAREDGDIDVAADFFQVAVHVDDAVHHLESQLLEGSLVWGFLEQVVGQEADSVAQVDNEP